MDTRLTNTVPHASIAPARLESAPVRNAVPTELAPPIAVSAQVGAEQTRWQKDKKTPAEAQTRQVETTFSIDRETGDLVYRVIDAETKMAVAQYPYESLLRLRAYFRSAEPVTK